MRDDSFDYLLKRILEINKNLKYYDSMTIENELDFILNGTYILDTDIESILNGTY